MIDNLLEYFLNGNGVLYLWQKMKDSFVAKVAGKDLSTNDYTDADKQRLYGIAEGANKTTVSDSLTSDSSTDALSARQGKVLDERISTINSNIGNLGGGDMLKNVYDINGDGKVDKAENADNATKFGGQDPTYYAKTSELSGYIPAASAGASSGVATLGPDGKVPTTQLPETAPAEHTHQIAGVIGLENELNEVIKIANGKCESYVFDTVELLDAELEKPDFTKDLKTGDIFYIRATEVPDYWWDADTGTKQILETTKVDLPVLSNADIDAIIGS